MKSIFSCMRNWVIVLSVASLSATAWAQTEADQSQALNSLLTTKRFESARVGYVGSLSENARHLAILLKSNSPEQSFRVLLADGSLPAKLYGLCGLEIMGVNIESEQAALMDRYGDEPVLIMVGCIVSETEAGELLKEIANGFCQQYVIDFDAE